MSIRKQWKAYHVRSALILMEINYLNPSFTIILLKVSIQVNSYSDDEKKEIYLFSQLNAVGNFATGTIVTDALTDTQIALIASASKNLPGISISNFVGIERF